MPDGILIIDKPTGWTSMDVCAKLRGILREKRIGHAGTLDPMATGVLPVFVGRATKAVQFAENGRKEYRAVLKLGTVTDTQDTTGTVLKTAPVTAGRLGKDIREHAREQRQEDGERKRKHGGLAVERKQAGGLANLAKGDG